MVPQIVYYYYAYTSLVNQGHVKVGEPINVVVPTGNFGNILAAYYAKQMGLPIAKFICASNDNKVLYDFIRTGTYDKKREFILTSSPSMDILISSNLERLIYHIAGNDPEINVDMMSNLSQAGEYTITDTMKDGLSDFIGNYSTDEETSKTIKKVFEQTQYLLDTHTAVGYSVYEKYKATTKDETKTVIASTASPYKFLRSVMVALDQAYDNFSDFELIKKMEEISGVEIPLAIKEIIGAEVLHKTECTKEEMKQEVSQFLSK